MRDELSTIVSEEPTKEDKVKDQSEEGCNVVEKQPFRGV